INNQVIENISFINKDVPFLIASSYQDSRGDVIIPSHKYNGKIDRPRIANKALSIEEIALWIENPQKDNLVAAWDFSHGITKSGFQHPEYVHDLSINQIHGKTVNLPTRAMTGYNWDSSEQNFIHAPEQY